MEKFKYNESDGTITGYTFEGAVYGIDSILDVKVDYSKSLFNPRVSKIVTEECVIKNLRWCQTLRKLVELGGGELAEGVNISRVGGNRGKYIVKLAKGVAVVETLIKQEPVQETVEEVVEDVEESAPEEIATPTSELPDFVYAEGLYDAEDDKGCRKALDKYAEKFDVKLNGRKSFKNMLKDFKNSFEVSE